MAKATPPLRKTLYLIDGYAQFYRAYFAIRSGMTSPVTGEPTNMIYGFVGMLIKLLRDYKPDYLAVVIDVSGDRESFRSELLPQYKANRKEMPDDLRPQIQRALSIVQGMGVPVLGEPGFEADDVIATIVRRVRREHPEIAVRIISKDKDLTQLLDGNVELFDVHTDHVVSAAEIFKAEGVEPRHVVDMLALIGDSVDNIPGVPGIGPKTAAQLILHYGSADNLLDHLHEIKGKRRENLEASRDQIALSKQLVQLRDDLDLTFALEHCCCDVHRMTPPEVAAMFRELGFSRHQEELESLLHSAGQDIKGVLEGISPISSAIAESKSKRKREAPIGGLFEAFDAEARASAGEPARGNYQPILSEMDLKRLVQRVKEAGRFAIDTETTGLSPLLSELCGVSIAVEAGEAWYIPVRCGDSQPLLDCDVALNALKPLLESAKITKIAHNLKFDRIVFRRHGITLSGPQFDTMVAAYLIDASRSAYGLDTLALALLDYTCIPITDLIGRGKAQKCFDEASLTEATIYAAEDADITLRLHDVLAPELRKLGLEDLFETLEMPLVDVLAELEYNGIRVDPDELGRQKKRLAVRIDALRDEISDAAPHPFNPDSPKQLCAALFNKPDMHPAGLGLRPLKRGKTGPSTDSEVLERLAADTTIESPLPQLILEYRQLTKLVNTYLDSLRDAINPDTGRVHASFNQTVAATGRLSSSDPNLQNIPIRTEVGREIRRAFVADEGNVLLTADYSQIELRILAHLSNDPAMIAAFQGGEDIHRTVAAEVFGAPLDGVTREQRDSAKMVNFGIVYGVTPRGLARRLGSGVTVEDAREIISNYKHKFSRINAFLEQCIDDAHRHGYVETMMKRRRPIPQIYSNQPQQRSLGERMAINSVVQGSAADLIKVAMVDIHGWLPTGFPQAKMVLQIHDELVFECSEEDADRLQSFVRERMEKAMTLNVPLAVGSAWSPNWIDAK